MLSQIPRNAEQARGSTVYQSFVDVDRLLEDCPHHCFIAGGGGQGSHVPVELCQIYISNQVSDRKCAVHADFDACS